MINENKLEASMPKVLGLLAMTSSPRIRPPTHILRPPTHIPRPLVLYTSTSSPRMLINQNGWEVQLKVNREIIH